jgi:tripeptidyl-peptidase-1
VSEPSHPRYGQHLGPGAVNDLIRPSQSTLNEVEKWLCSCGIRRGQLQYSPAKDWIKVKLPIESAEALLDTKYLVFKHEDGSILVRTPQWSLPLHLHEHIETIQPTNSFLRSMAKRSNLRVVPGVGEIVMPPAILGNNKATVAQACNVTAVTTDCLRTLYGTSHPLPC